MTAFLDALQPVFETMAMLFCVSFVGYWIARKKIIDESGVMAMSRLLVDVIIPARMLTAMMEGLDGETINEYATVILVLILTTIATLAIGFAATKVWPGKSSGQDRVIWSLSAFQNGIYVPLPLILALVPPSQQVTATIYVAGAVVVMVFFQWTMGVWFLRGDSTSSKELSIWKQIRGAFNPPLLAIFIGSALAFVPVLHAAAKGEAAPAIVAIPVEAGQLLGSTLGPVAMLVLGMLIGQCQLGKALRFRVLTISSVVRLLVSPLLMLWFLYAGPLQWVSPLVALVLIVEAASPPATNLSVIARRYNGDWQEVSASLLVTYLLALITVPFFTALVIMQH